MHDRMMKTRDMAVRSGRDRNNLLAAVRRRLHRTGDAQKQR
jgi:hypothetical protein